MTIRQYQSTLDFEAVQARNSAWIIFIQYIYIAVMTCSAIVNKLALPKVDIPTPSLTSTKEKVKCHTDTLLVLAIDEERNRGLP